MLNDKQCRGDGTYEGDGVQVAFLPTNKGKKVSMYTLHAFPGLIT